MVGLPDGADKNFKNMCNRLDTILACDGETDKRMDGRTEYGRTDRQTDILPRHSPRYAYASLDGKVL